MKKTLLLTLAVVAFAAAPTYKVARQDQSRRRKPLGLRLSWTAPIIASMSRTAPRPRSSTPLPTKSSAPSPAPAASTASPSRTTSTGFTSDGADNDVTVFDLKTMMPSAARSRPAPTPTRSFMSR